jgi:hypothetical protein
MKKNADYWFTTGVGSRKVGTLAFYGLLKFLFWIWVCLYSEVCHGEV